MSIKGQGHSLTLVKGHSDFKVKCLTFGLYTQVSDSGPLGPLVCHSVESMENDRPSTFSVHGVRYSDTHCIIFSKSAGYLLASLLTSPYARPQFLRHEYTIVFSNSYFFS